MIDVKALDRLIRDSGISFKENAGSYKFTCPHCEKPEKLWMLKKTGQFICFYCAEIEGYKGRAEYALRDILGKTVTELQAILYPNQVLGQEGMAVELKAFQEEEEDYVSVTPEMPEMPEIALPIGVVSTTEKAGAKGFQYLYDRGIPLWLQASYKLQYWPERRRVIFPVEMHGKLIGYQARTIVDEEPKILTSTGLNRQRAIMFFDHIMPSNSVIICEGPIDAIKLSRCFTHGAIPVATMGKAVTREQIDAILATGTQRIYLALDPDANAEVARLAYDLIGKVELYLLQPPAHREDLGACTLEEASNQFVFAKPYNRSELHSYLREPSFA